MPNCDCLLNPDNPSQDPDRNNYLDWPDPNIGTPADTTLPYPPYVPQNPDARQLCPMSATHMYYCDMPNCMRHVCNNCAVRNVRNLEYAQQWCSLAVCEEHYHETLEAARAAPRGRITACIGDCIGRFPERRRERFCTDCMNQLMREYVRASDLEKNRRRTWKYERISPHRYPTRHGNRGQAPAPGQIRWRWVAKRGRPRQEPFCWCGRPARNRHKRTKPNRLVRSCAVCFPHPNTFGIVLGQEVPIGSLFYGPVVPGIFTQE